MGRTIDVWADRVKAALNETFADGYSVEVITGLNERILITDPTGDQPALMVVTTAMGWLVENG